MYIMSVLADECVNRKSDIVFANSPGDQGSVPGRVIPKT